MSMTPADFRAPPRGEDLPCSDGEPLETERHVNQMTLLIDSLHDGWRERRDFYVGGDMFLYFSELHSRRKDFRGPDVFVVLDVEPKERKAWVVWEEEGRTPDVIIEITSKSTEAIDRGEKMRVYASLLKTAAYYLYDPFTHSLEGFTLDPSARVYRPLDKDARGHLPCPPLGLSLGVVTCTFRDRTIPWLRWIDREGRVLPTSAESATARAEEQARRADQEARHAAEQARRADEEARRAAELAAKLAEYEERFGKLPG